MRFSLAHSCLTDTKRAIHKSKPWPRELALRRRTFALLARKCSHGRDLDGECGHVQDHVFS